MIDCGHGGSALAGKSTPYGSRARSGAAEKDLTLELGRRVVQALGGDAVLTRDGDYNLTLTDRLRVVEQHRPRAFISLHADEGSERGPLTWTHASASGRSTALAHAIHRELVRAGAGADRGVRRGELALLAPRGLPRETDACLVEVDSIDNPTLGDPRVLDRMAGAIARGVEAWWPPSFLLATPFRTTKASLSLDRASALATACTAALTPELRELCFACVDLTKGTLPLPYFGFNDREELYAASSVKVCAMFVAFELRARVQAFIDAIGGSFSDVKTAWFDAVNAGIAADKQNFPELASIFEVTGAGRVELKSSGKSFAELDSVGVFGIPGPDLFFGDWVKLMIRFSNDHASSRVIRTLGFSYLNGALEAAGFFDAGIGLRLTGDYKGHDWARNEGMGATMSPRWKTFEGRPRTNMAGSAEAFALMLALLARGELVSSTADADMREMMDQSGAIGLNPRFFKIGLESGGRAPTEVHSKIGIGEGDGLIHDVAIIDRDAPALRYVAIGLGAKSQGALTRLIGALDQAVIDTQ